MIHHISMAAENPLHVAQVLAEIFQGQVAPFPPHPGSYMVLSLDDQGTMIEIYPDRTELLPGSGQDGVGFSQNLFATSFSATHAAISVPTEQVEIERIAEREGWRAVRCSREDLFEVIEFWVENRLLLEFLTPSMAPRYISFMNPENLQRTLQELMAGSLIEEPVLLAQV